MKVLLKIVTALFLLVLIASCSAKTDISVRVNGVLMPNEVQNSILSLNKDKGIRIVWYYYRTHSKTIRSQGMSEVIQEEQPLDFQMPKVLPSDTTQVGIRIFVYNPFLLRFRISDSSEGKEGNKIYDGIRDNYETSLNGSVAKDRQNQIGARVDLMGNNGSLVVSSVNIGDLIYSIDSPKTD